MKQYLLYISVEKRYGNYGNSIQMESFYRLVTAINFKQAKQKYKEWYNKNRSKCYQITARNVKSGNLAYQKALVNIT